MTAATTDMAGLSGDARPTNRASEVGNGFVNSAPLRGLAPASQAGAPESLEFTLPLPPSTNALFKNIGRGRAKSKAYRNWIDEATRALTALDLAPICSRYRLTIFVPVKMRGDASNRVKAIEDLLVKLKLTPDDSQADAVAVERALPSSAKVCTVIVQKSPTPMSVGGGPKPLSAVPSERGGGP